MRNRLSLSAEVDFRLTSPGLLDCARIVFGGFHKRRVLIDVEGTSRSRLVEESANGGQRFNCRRPADPTVASAETQYVQVSKQGPCRRFGGAVPELIGL